MTDADRDRLEVLSRPVSRRGALALLGGLGLVVAGCSNSDPTDATATTTGALTSTTSGSTTTATGTAATTVTSCAAIPEETGGPYPGDGTNGPNALAENGVVRKDIRSSFDGSSGTAEGVPYTMQFTVVNIDNGCKPLTGAAIYVWHCDRDGNYSMYSGAAQSQNFLRGVQQVDGNGVATFTSIFPACYSGRWPHVHFEVYPSASDATKATNKLVTSQLALPRDACDAAYTTSGYEQSVRNLSQVSLTSDMVFRDGVSLQTPSMTGNAASGYVSSLVVGVSGSV